MRRGLAHFLIQTSTLRFTFGFVFREEPDADENLGATPLSWPCRCAPSPKQVVDVTEGLLKHIAEGEEKVSTNSGRVASPSENFVSHKAARRPVFSV